jgi:hypothetical protein
MRLRSGTFSPAFFRRRFPALQGIGYISPLEAPDALADACKNML